jgi:hypothetical protein
VACNTSSAPLAWLFPDRAEKSPQTTLYLATSSEVEQVAGEYFVHSKAVEVASEVYDEDAVRSLWPVSSVLIGLI